MSNTKFTEGSWVKDYKGTIGHIKTMAHKESNQFPGTPTIAKYNIGTMYISKEEEQANGHLIKASPLLYKALEEILSLAAPLIYDHLDWTSEDHESIIAARKALASARGDSHDT